MNTPYTPYIQFTLLIFSLVIVAESADNVVRKPKLFYGSTSATTSTLKTGSICYVSSKTAVEEHWPRWREGCWSAVSPSQAREAREGREVQPSLGASGQGRDGRFLYWITTTSISTSTSFTSTITLSSVQCTPTGATLCG